MKSLLPTFAKVTAAAALALGLLAASPLGAVTEQSGDEAVVTAPVPETAPAAPAPAEPPAATEPPSAEVAPAAPAAPLPPPSSPVWVDRGEVVVVGNSVVIAANERASKVVAVGGNVEIHGRVDGEVVAVFGNMLIDGPVGKTVTVMGSLSLGPNACIGGDAVAIGGGLRNPHHAPIGGKTTAIGSYFPNPLSVLTWLGDAATHARLLSFHVAWPWYVFGGVTLFLLGLAAVFGRGLNACARSLEERPGATLVTAIALLPGLPLFTVLLVCTLVGALLLPFLFVAVVFAFLFGKAALLVFLGRAVLRVGGRSAAAEQAWLTLLLGAVVVALCYCVPVAGMLVWALTGWIGLGMVVTTLIDNRRAEKASAAAARAAAPSVVPAVVAGSAATPAASAATVGVAPASVSAAAVPPVASATAGVVPPPMPENVAPTAAPVPLPPPPVALAATLPRAEFGVRLGALLIDIVLVAVGGGVSMVLHAIPFPLLFGLYIFGFWLWKGTTVGGIVFNLKVVRLDGRAVDAATAVVRTLVAFLSAVTLVGFLWCLWDEERQTWHDKVAGTTVVRVPKSTPLV